MRHNFRVPTGGIRKYFSAETKIIDLSNDFRLRNDSIFDDKSFVYGLPELQKEKIKEASYIANPGCFATTIQLALLPLAEHNLLKDDIHFPAGNYNPMKYPEKPHYPIKPDVEFLKEKRKIYNTLPNENQRKTKED